MKVGTWKPGNPTVYIRFYWRPASFYFWAREYLVPRWLPELQKLFHTRSFFDSVLHILQVLCGHIYAFTVVREYDVPFHVIFGTKLNFNLVLREWEGSVHEEVLPWLNPVAADGANIESH